MHVEKFTKGAIFGLLSHVERKFANYSNENIDTDKKGDDYTFTAKAKPAPIANISGKKRYDEIMTRCKCQNRKDVNVLCSVCLHLPKDVPPEEEERFFRVSYKFLKQRYCQYDNLVTAVVHRDEERPHLHFVFVPVVKDKKKDRLKVSAKEVVNRTDLKTLHKDLSDRLQEVFGRDMGVYLKPQESPENDFIAALRQIQNKISPKDFKTLIDRFETLQQEYRAAQTDIERLKATKNDIEKQIENLKKNEIEKTHREARQAIKEIFDDLDR